MQLIPSILHFPYISWSQRGKACCVGSVPLLEAADISIERITDPRTGKKFFMHKDALTLIHLLFCTILNDTLTFIVSHFVSLLIGSILLIQMSPKLAIMLVGANDATGAARLVISIFVFYHPEARLGSLLA
ncbi:hypothetical protein WN944_015260 [Citrus x changshan-huyou]|uniref:Uncharacterized protein n=1 Tax=Citrus x changshan-huyou TaxID=2935761 RepID=A0AAP0MC57_9ROSI